MNNDVSIEKYSKNYSTAQGFLLDTYQPGMYGGTGQTFAWERIPTHLQKPIILAGGLTPQNVATAIREVHPYGVDVVSGVEASQGIKDPDKMRAFIRQVRALDCS